MKIRRETLGMGKQTGANSDAGWGTVQILIYPAGTEVPPNKQVQAGIASKTTQAQQAPSATATPKQ